MTKLLNLAHDNTAHDNTNPAKPRAFKAGDRVTVGSDSGTVWEVEPYGYQVSFDFTQGRRATLIDFDNDPPMLPERSDSKAPPLERDLTSEQRAAVKILEQLGKREGHLVWDWLGNTRAYGSINGVEWNADPTGSVALMLEIGSGMLVSLYPQGSSETPGVQVHWETGDGQYGQEAVRSARLICEAFLDANQCERTFKDLLEHARENDELRVTQCARRISEAFSREVEILPPQLQSDTSRKALELIQLSLSV